MPKLDHPPHPTHDYSCEKCQYWFIEKAMNMAVINPQGAMVPLQELIKQGQNVASVTTARCAPCTRMPGWQQVTENHWCYEYAARVKQ